jgi:NADH:ubiquinone oxidoreductase subunit C
MTEKLHAYVEKLKANNEAWVTDLSEAHGEVTVVVTRDAIVNACNFLKSDHGFDMLADLCGGRPWVQRKKSAV